MDVRNKVGEGSIQYMLGISPMLLRECHIDNIYNIQTLGNDQIQNWDITTILIVIVFIFHF